MVIFASHGKCRISSDCALKRLCLRGNCDPRKRDKSDLSGPFSKDVVVTEPPDPLETRKKKTETSNYVAFGVWEIGILNRMFPSCDLEGSTSLFIYLSWSGQEIPAFRSAIALSTRRPARNVGISWAQMNVSHQSYTAFRHSISFVRNVWNLASSNIN